MIVVPSIDLRQGRVVRLQQGDYARQLNYSIDPLQAAHDFAAAGAQWMHIVDLDGAKEGRPMQTSLINSIAAIAKLNIQVGGGVRDLAHVEELLAAGVARVVLGTKALEDWPWFENLAHQPAMSQKLILALDAKDGLIATRAWTQTSGQKAVDVAHQVSDWPLAAILYTDVAKDGMLTGPNLTTTRDLAQAGKIPVIASGGVGNIDHVRLLARLPIWGAILGRSLHEGKVNLAQAIAVAETPKSE